MQQIAEYCYVSSMWGYCVW